MRVTPGKGSGSFVVSKISKGEMVASFGGNVIDHSELTNYSYGSRTTAKASAALNASGWRSGENKIKDASAD